jgi:hypothetical protein
VLDGSATQARTRFWRNPTALPRLLREAALAIDAEAARERDGVAGYDRAPLIAFSVGALCLTVMHATTGPRVLASLLRTLHAVFPDRVAPFAVLNASRWYALLDVGLWIATRALAFLVLPVLAIRLVLRAPVADFGLRAAGLRAHLGTYAALYALVLPLSIVAAMRPEFVAYYPLYRRAGESWLDLLSWEVLYAFQFFCVEFFFRGFLPLASRTSLGSHAAFAAMVPYCITHFGKPWLEVLASIPAGIALGLLALATRSIWGGVLLHVAIAWTMDALALARTTGWPSVFWPK